MPGGFPSAGGGAVYSNVGAATGTSTGTQVAPGSAGGGVFGSWTQLISSTAVDAIGFFVTLLGNNPSAGTNYCSGVQIGIGASGSEIAITPPLLVMGGFGTTSAQSTTYFCPLAVPAGTRISAQAASSGSSGTAVSVSLTLADGSWGEPGGYALLTAYGITSGITGQSIDAGGTANTKGSWTQLASSTAYDIEGFFICWSNAGFTAQASASEFLVDVGVGASGSEVVILPNLSLADAYGNTTNALSGPNHIFWRKIPAGTRLAARCQCGATSAAARKPGLILIGIT
ncbi:MAG TPA: hypothetical protein VKS60_00210 [Stellaceae bacterium]|nr:hypothetical protein [Stellaceae bacterium]